ncbi:MAG: SDR family oxidoreductase, partial [Blastocatellia bacterium]
MKLDGKVSLITGGGKGIGKAIAERFAEEGSVVMICGTDEQALSQTIAEITGKGSRAKAVAADISSETSVERLISAAIREFGRIDILVNNSGISGPTAPLVKLTTEDWEHTLAVNLTGTFLCSRYALPGMIERKSGRIINITSVAGLRGYALRSPYCASKWAMIGLTKSLALEVGRYDITVNAIAPGAVRGPRIDRVIRSRAAEMGRTVEEMEREYT